MPDRSIEPATCWSPVRCASDWASGPGPFLLELSSFQKGISLQETNRKVVSHWKNGWTSTPCIQFPYEILEHVLQVAFTCTCICIREAIPVCLSRLKTWYQVFHLHFSPECKENTVKWGFDLHVYILSTAKSTCSVIWRQISGLKSHSKYLESPKPYPWQASRIPAT